MSSDREQVFLKAGIPASKIPAILSNAQLSDALLHVIQEAGVEGLLDKQQGNMFLSIASKLVPSSSNIASPSQNKLIVPSQESGVVQPTQILAIEHSSNENDNSNSRTFEAAVLENQTEVHENAARIITRFFRVYKFRIVVLRSIHRSKKRFNCIHEILSTERHYVDALKALQQDFEVPLRQDKVIPATKIATIFSNAQALYSFHNQFCSTLADRISKWTARRTIADTFLPIIPFLKMYVDYVTRFDESHEILVSLRSNSAWNVFLEKRKSSTGLKGERYLSTLLIAPVQRISRYELLLREVAKNTGNDHEDYPILQQAIEAIHDVNLQINAAKRQADKKKQLEQVHKRLKMLGKNYQEILAQADAQQEIAESVVFLQSTVQTNNNGSPKTLGAQLQLNQFKHQFQKQAIAKPSFCDYCSKLILGITQPHYLCNACGYDVHERCLPFVPKECTHAKQHHSLTSTGNKTNSSRYYIREGRARWGSEDSTAKNSCMVFLFNDCLIIANILDSQERPLYFSKVITWGFEDSGGTLKTKLEPITPHNSPFFGVIYGLKISPYKTGITYLFFDTTKDTQEWEDSIQTAISRFFKILRGEIDQDQTEEEEFIIN